MKRLLIALIALLIALPVNAEVKKLVTYVGYTEEYITAGWDIRPEGENVDYYKIKMMHFERDIEIARGQVDHPGNLVSLSFPYGGHYVIMITACRIEGEEEVCARECSDPADETTCEEQWSYSDNAEDAMVDGQPMGWWVYKYISPPSGGGVE